MILGPPFLVIMNRLIEYHWKLIVWILTGNCRPQILKKSANNPPTLLNLSEIETG
jgi:hypothetical protein